MAALVASALACPAARSARLADAPVADPALVCEQAGARAEQEFGLPRGLLTAIGVVESGRWQPALGRSTPWPFAIDAGGDDFMMDSAAAAIAKVAALRADGRDSLDVGCFQINLVQHPEAFASLEEGFDPTRNAAAAARFLIDLRQRLGTWDGAVASYHSGFAALGEPYRARVLAAWSGAPGRSGPHGTWSDTGGDMGGGAGVRMAASRGASLAAAAPVIRVFVPGGLAMPMPEPGAAFPPVSHPVVAGAIIRLTRVRLPRVFTPSARL